MSQCFVLKDAPAAHLGADVPELTFSFEPEKSRKSPQQDYYNELRGPILQVRGRRADVQLSFVSSEDDDILESEKFVCEVLEPFSVTSRGKERRHITLKNEGTTAIRYQWLRFPPNKDMQFLLANPAGCVLPGGYLNSIPKSKHKRKVNGEKVFKSCSLEFRFRELPSVLLPGQSLEFPIVFRSSKQGYFYETLYLLTHPKLRDQEGRGYSLRLTGICMDPDLLEFDNLTSRPENISERFKQTTLEKEAMDIMDSILDHSLFIKPNQL